MWTIEATATFVLVLVIIGNKGVEAVCSGEYGAEPCRFIPAPPGRTPNCARPGLTYCEHPTHYPGQLIQYLIDKWRYDHTSLLSNESPEEFNSYFIPADGMYGPPRVAYGPPPNTLHDFSPEPIYIPKPSYPILQQPGNTYIPPPPDVLSQNFSDGFLGYPDRRYNLPEPELPNNQLYNYKVGYNQVSGNTYVPAGPPQTTYYTPYEWWKRHSRDLAKNQSNLSRRRRSLHKYLSVENDPLRNITSSHLRQKRQTLIGEPLCQIRTQYIMPRAALNNKGNWMYVVNMPDMDNRYTQLVKSEVCLSSQCSGLCNVPTGYTSQCEQKYVQKRLIALEGSGDRLYTDVFWFPSCCICTISTR